MPVQRKNATLNIKKSVLCTTSSCVGSVVAHLTFHAVGKAMLKLERNDRRNRQLTLLLPPHWELELDLCRCRLYGWHCTWRSAQAGHFCSTFLTGCGSWSTKVEEKVRFGSFKFRQFFEVDENFSVKSSKSFKMLVSINADFFWPALASDVVFR